MSEVIAQEVKAETVFLTGVSKNRRQVLRDRMCPLTGVAAVEVKSIDPYLQGF